LSYESRVAREQILVSLTDFRAPAELKLADLYDLMLHQAQLSLSGIASMRAPVEIEPPVMFDSYAPKEILLDDKFDLYAPKELSLLDFSDARVYREESLIDLADVKSPSYISLKSLTESRMPSMNTLFDAFTASMPQTMSLLGRYESRVAREQGMGVEFEARVAKHLSPPTRYDLNIKLGYNVSAVDVNTDVITDLGFVPYVEGVDPTIPGITLLPGTYDIKFVLQGFRWSGWGTERIFRVVITQPTQPPVIQWSNPTYLVSVGKATAFWTWVNLLGTFSPFRFLFWKSTTQNPPNTSLAPSYILADIPRKYGHIWPQQDETYIALSAQYIDSDGYVVTTSPIYATIPTNIYIAPDAPDGQFGYYRGIEPVDQTVYDEGVPLLSVFDEDIVTDEGGFVYDQYKEGKIYVV